MNPSERAIEEAVDRLSASPGAFQRLAEEYAALEYPDLFGPISPRGRNASDVTIKGWPDFESGEAAGEATISRAWRDHLREDIRKAKAAGVSAFVYIAWAAAPSRDEARALHEDAVKTLNLAPSFVRFAFKPEIRRTLSQPRFARHWIETLHLPAATAPFVLITHAAEPGDPSNRLFGVDGSRVSFLPTRTEYLEGSVHHAEVFDAVNSRLSLDGIAFVTGRGASGKTALALSIAFTEPYRSRPAYYLDCGAVASAPMISERVLSVISSRADRDILFIIDNVHLQQDLAAEIIFHWRRAHMGSRLLFIGRSPIQAADPVGGVSPLRGLPTTPLRVTESDLRGVFRRIMARADYEAMPPTQLVEEWLKIFKGDLVAFSAALSNQQKILGSSYWDLSPAHAADYIKASYLHDVSDDERAALFRLSAMSVLELALPSVCAPPLGFRTSMQRGIVYSRPAQAPGGTEFLLAHSGVGELILATNTDVKREILYEEICRASPSAGLGIALRLRDLRQPELASAILRILWENRTWPLGPDRLDNLINQARSLVNSGVAPRSEVDFRMTENRHLIYESVLKSPPHDIYKAINSTRAEFTEWHRRIVECLGTPKVRQMIATSAEQLAPHNVIALLSVYRQHEHLRKFYRSLVDTIYSKQYTVRQRNQLIDTNLSIITGLFHFLMDEHRSASNELRQFILSDDNIELFVEKLYSGSLESMVSVLREPFFANTLLSRVVPKTWFERRSALAPSGPEVLTSIIELLDSLSYGHLSTGICVGALCNPTAKAWSRSNVQAEHVLVVLDAAIEEQLERVDHFLRVAVFDSGLYQRLSWRQIHDFTERLFVAALGAESPPIRQLQASEYIEGMRTCLSTKPVVTDEDVLHALAVEGWSRIGGQPHIVSLAAVTDHHGRDGLLRTSYVEQLGPQAVLGVLAACWTLRDWSSEDGKTLTTNPNQVRVFQRLVSQTPLPAALSNIFDDLKSWLEDSALAGP